MSASDKSRLISKLQGLLRGATLTEEQEKDAALVQEARTKAYVLLKLCKENNVKISFSVPGAAKGKSEWHGDPWQGGAGDDFLEEVMRAAREGERKRKEARAAAEREQARRNAAQQEDLQRKHRENIARKEAEERERQAAQARSSKVDLRQSLFEAGMIDGAQFWNEVFNRNTDHPNFRTSPPIQVNINGKEVEGSTRGKVEMDTPMIRTASFAGICRKCKLPYAVRDRIWWRRGIGSVHEHCDPSILGGVGTPTPC